MSPIRLMMKILFLNPHLHDSTLVATLRKRGIAVLVCESVNEADLVLKLHGRTIALVCGHDQPGVELNEALKQNPRTTEIPVILSFSQWTDQQIAAHAQQPMGANAYLRSPFADDAFISVAEKVLGRELNRPMDANPMLDAEFATRSKMSSSMEWATIMINRPLKAKSAESASPVPAPYSPEKTKVLSASEVAAMLKAGSGGKKSNKLEQSSPAMPVSVHAAPTGLPSTESPIAISPVPAHAEPAADLPLAVAAPVPTPTDKPVHELTSVVLSSGGTEPVLDLAPMSSPSSAPSTTQGGLVSSPISVKLEETQASHQPEMAIAPEFNLDALAALPAEDASKGGPVLSAAPSDLPPLPSDSIPSLAPESSADLPFSLGEAIAPPPSDDLSSPEINAEHDATRVQDMNVMPVRAPSLQATTVTSTGTAAARAQDEELDSESMQEMPYLAKKAFASPLAYQQPLDDAIIPGGAVQSPDLETLKRYLLLREQDVAALSNALRQAKEQVTNVDQQLRHERAINTEFAHLTQEQDRRIKNFEKEKQIALESAQKEVDELKFEMRKRADRVRLMEAQVRDATTETEKLKERVRSDIRKIRTREKELENRLEIMKKDSEALLMAREQKIIELKRKLDLLEFNMDLLQNQYEKEKQNSASLTEKLMKAAQVVRVAGGLLHPNETVDLSEILPGEGSQTDLKTTKAS